MAAQLTASAVSPTQTQTPTALPAPHRRGRPRTLPAAWPAYALLYGYPLWWILGLQGFIWPILAVPMAASLLRRRVIKAPRGFGIYLLFLAWVVVSAMQLASLKQLLAFSYRFSLYASAAILLLFLWSLTPRQLPVARLARAGAFLWVVAVIGGFIGLALPGAQFSSVLELLLPQHIAQQPFVHSLVHLELSSPSSLLGYSLPRPKAPFNYTNEWGSNLALLTPLAIYSVQVVQSRRWRLLILGLLGPALIPAIVSINRGLWISVTVGALYVALRAAGRGKVKLLLGVLGVGGILGMIVALSPLGGIVTDRAGKSNVQGRAYLYQQSVEKALESPVLGHGAPLPSDDPTLSADASVGTHGQIWTLLVSQGIPGAVLFVAFLGFTLLLTWHVSRRGLWPHAVIVIAGVQLAFYNVLPMQIHVVVIAMVLCWRDVLGRRNQRYREGVAPTAGVLPPPEGLRRRELG